MNIFAFDPDPKLSALWLDDVRKNKLLLESAQMLSTAIRYLDPTTKLPVYKSAHQGHPCTLWTHRSRGNFKWLTEYMSCLGAQRSSYHKSMELLPYFKDYAKNGLFFSEDQTPFANCAANADLGLSFKHIPDVHQAYRMYISERWRLDTIHVSWYWGQEPDWRIK